MAARLSGLGGWRLGWLEWLDDWFCGSEEESQWGGHRDGGPQWERPQREGASPADALLKYINNITIINTINNTFNNTINNNISNILIYIL